MTTFARTLSISCLVLHAAATTACSGASTSDGEPSLGHVSNPPKGDRSESSAPAAPPPSAPPPTAAPPSAPLPSSSLLPANACSNSHDVVYGFVTESGTDTVHFYSTSPKAPVGYVQDGPVFHLPDATTATSPLYLLHSMQADDYLVSTSANEGASLGYTLYATLGAVFTHAQDGAVPLHRFVQPSPLRHAAGIGTIPAATYSEESQNPLGFACPLP